MSHTFLLQIYKKSGVLVQSEKISSFPFKIGRSPENDLVLPFPEISRQQFLIDFDPVEAIFVLENLGSKNSAQLNGRPFQSTREPIANELRFTLGDFDFRLLHKAANLEETRIFDLAAFDSHMTAQNSVKARVHGAFKVVQKNFQTHPMKSSGYMASVLLGLIFFSFGVSAVFQGESGGTLLSESQLMKQVQLGIFEVVYPKAEDSFVVYEKPLPVEKLPFKDRTDKYVSIGTAFYIGKGDFVSAAHVFEADHKNPERDYFLRNSDGQVYKMGEVTGASGHKDLIVFKMIEEPKKLRALKLQKQSEVGDAVYTAGNAHGEGLALRTGVLSSFTPENLDGLWNYIRYSAPASPGNSGGPLINGKGEVLGVVVMKSQGENLNFAVPVELLETLPKDHAEFAYQNAAEVESGFRLNADRWMIKEKLPAKLGPLSRAASDGLNQEYFKNRAKFEEKFGDKIFPRDPALEDYLVEAKLTRGAGFMEIDKDKSGKWTSAEDEGQLRDLKARGSLWYNVSKGDSGSRVDLAYYFPKTETVSSYLNQPKKLMDMMLKELEWSRTFAGERVLIESYGDPLETTKWQDGLGRKWVSWVWRTSFDEMSHVVSCMPFPKTLACRWSYTSQNREDLNRFYEKIDAGRRLRSFYSGNFRQWKAYLELGPEWVPETIKELNPQLTEKSEYKFSIAVAGKNLEFHHSVSDEVEFSLGLNWSPTDPKKIELKQVSFFENTDVGEFVHVYSMYHSSRKEGSPTYSDSWKKIAFSQAPYDGRTSLQGESIAASKTFKLLPAPSKDPVNPTSMAWVGTCSVSSFLPEDKKRSFMNRCQSQWGSAELRVPSSIKALKKKK